MFTEHSNVYTNLSDLWAGTPYNPNPGLGSVWVNNGSNWVVNGLLENHASTAHVDNTWYDFEFGVSTSQLSSISSANSVEYLRNGTYTLNIDGVTAIGSYHGTNLIGPLTIEVEIRRPYTTGDETVAFNTFGATFEADITVDDGAVVLWDFGDTTSSSDHPTKDWGEAGDRMVLLTVTPHSALQAIVIGYDHADGGSTTDPMLPDLATQDVRDVYGLTNATGLQVFAASYTEIGSLDVHGLTALRTVECYNSDLLMSINLTGCVSLSRLCLEGCNLEELDLSTCVGLEDLRAAVNPRLADITWPTTADSLWHVCIRDNPSFDLTTFPVETWPVIDECWAWNSHIDGYLVFDTDASLSLLMTGNTITGVDLTLAVNTNAVNLSNNNLDQESVDSVLITLAGHSVSGGSVNLTNNVAPSAAGTEAVSVLLSRGWSVSVDS